MVEQYKAYPEYKIPDNLAISSLPTHWKACPIASIADVIDPQPDHRAPTICDDGTGFPYIGIRDVRPDGSLNFETARPVGENAVLKQEKSFSIERGDIIFCKVGTLGLPRKILPHGRCALSATLVLIKPIKTFNSQFLVYALDSDIIHTQTSLAATGSTRSALGIQQIRKFVIPLPNTSEQQKIADFLDYETAKIDRLIEKQERLIELLKEKRQAVISHAVTKGLNPDAPLRSSGIDWLGDIPAHWEVSPLKYKSTLNPKKTELRTKAKNKCTFLPMEKLKTGSLVTDEMKSISEVFDGYTYFKNNDVLLAKVTPCFENKNIAIAENLHNGIGFGSTEIYVLRTGELLDKTFLFYRLQEDQFTNIATAAMTGAGGLKRVPSETINNFNMAFPNIEEQRKIVDFLDKQTIKIDRLIELTSKAAILIKERRTALISAAVTGKIDVRDWEPPKDTDNKKEEAA